MEQTRLCNLLYIIPRETPCVLGKSRLSQADGAPGAPDPSAMAFTTPRSPLSPRCAQRAAVLGWAEKSLLGLSPPVSQGQQLLLPQLSESPRGPGRRQPPRRGGRTGPAATSAGRSQLARAGGWGGARTLAGTCERAPARRQRVGLSLADPGWRGETAAAGGNPPRRASQPPPHSALPGLGHVQGCWRPRRRVGTDGSRQRDG